jgi:hypothetical protein
MSDEMAYLEVPQPLYNVDAELNAMAMLEYIMRQSDEVLTHCEKARVVEWFADRYGNEAADHEEN